MPNLAACRPFTETGKKMYMTHVGFQRKASSQREENLFEKQENAAF
jgi:hypothetical protein